MRFSYRSLDKLKPVEIQVRCAWFSAGFFMERGAVRFEKRNFGTGKAETGSPICMYSLDCGRFGYRLDGRMWDYGESYSIGKRGIKWD